MREILFVDKQSVIAFFDRCAPTWDANMVRREDVIGEILDNGGITQGIDVLDVACGTGVLFPDYLARGVKSLTGIDISPRMAAIAAGKYHRPDVTVICADVETYPFQRQFDAVMVYNALPHFPDPARLIGVLAGLVKPGGRLSVAHGMSRAKLDVHHSGQQVRKVSMGLISKEELTRLFTPYFRVDIAISDERMYQVSGTRL